MQEVHDITCNVQCMTKLAKFKEGNFHGNLPICSLCGGNVLNYLHVILDKEITSGEIKVVVTYNDIQLLDETYDACELLEKYGDQCPISTGIVYGTQSFLKCIINVSFLLCKGNTTMSITVEVPSDLPDVRQHIKHLWLHSCCFFTGKICWYNVWN